MSILPPSTLSHFGINVTDIEHMERFYTEVFGFIASDRGVRFNGQKVVFLTKKADDHHQLVLLEGRPTTPSFNVVNQISFGLQTLEDLRKAYTNLQAAGFNDLTQINHGNAWSVYFNDPEGNPIEVFVDSPFHTPQPCRGELDLRRPADEIIALTESLCKSRPDFSSHSDWQKQMSQRLSAVEKGASGA